MASFVATHFRGALVLTADRLWRSESSLPIIEVRLLLPQCLGTGVKLNLPGVEMGACFHRLPCHLFGNRSGMRTVHVYDGLETLAESMDARYGAAQVRPKAESDEVLDLDQRRKKAT